MLLDNLFGEPMPKVLKIIRKDGKMKTEWTLIPLSEPEGKIIKPLFPARKIKNEET